MRKILLFLFPILLVFLFSYNLSAQDASAKWPLTNPGTGGSGGVPSVSGALTAANELLKGIEINGYTGTNNSQRVRMAGTNNSWAANLIKQIDTVYVQFAVSPKVGTNFLVKNITLAIGASSTTTMKANIYYSTDPTFKNSVQIFYSTGNASNYLLSSALTQVTATPNVVVSNGGTLYLRVYPWHEASTVATGKYAVMQSIEISGIVEALPTPISAIWPYETDDKVIIKGTIIAQQTYHKTMKFYGTTTLPTIDNVNLKVGAIQTVSQAWKAEPKPTDTLYFQYEVSSKTGGTLTVNSVSMYLGGWYSTNLRAAIYYSLDATFATKSLLLVDSALVGNKVQKFNMSLNSVVNSGEKFYLRVYPYNKAEEGWAKLVAVDSVVIAGLVTGVTVDPPTVTTTTPTYISSTFLSTGGNISTDGGADITARGVCWNTTGNPSVANSKSTDGIGVGSFNTKVTGLTPNTKYYIKAYATNISGTSYGEEFTATTLEKLSVPAVTTAPVSNILVTTVTAGGEVTFWGGDPVTERGICFSTNSNPTINSERTINGKDIGTFTTTLGNLSANTTYYVRAYATNGLGTAYGEEYEFTTYSPSKTRTIIVAKDESGDVTTVQEAFDLVPLNSMGTIIIYIKDGMYKEKLKLASGKVNVIIRGQSRDKTILTYDDYSGKPGTSIGTSTSETLSIQANDVVVQNITIQNTATQAQAVALNVTGDRLVFEKCNILGYQDTYYTWNSGRVYNKDCFIEGTVDFIFGSGVAIFDNCTINEKRNGGTLTAAATYDYLKFGYVFMNCKITTDPVGYDGNPINSFLLGRPWQNSPQTVFIKCEEPAILDPAGWSTWNVTPALYAEYKCTGAGSNTSKRINISRQLTDAEAATYTITNIFSKNTNTSFGFDWTPVIPVSVEEEFSYNNSIPTEYAISQNYPNPFNPSTSIKYQLPQNENVSVIVYDILGKEIQKLVNQEQLAGYYEVRFDAKKFASGIYFCRIQAGNFSDVKKMLLVK
jgi:pectin methylesterase-like acyl-CoA thioesterase